MPVRRVVELLEAPAGLYAFGALALAAAASVSTAWAQSTEPLIQQSDLIYQGAFRVPADTSAKGTFSYGGTALAYDPGSNSLYLTGHDWYQLTAEISIPTPVNTTDITKLNRSAIVQNFTDLTEGKLASINPGDPNSHKIGGHMVWNGKLVVTGYSYYDGNGSQTASHFVRPLSFSTTGQVQGPFRVGTRYPGWVDGWMMPVPAEWVARFGGPALTGNCCLAIAGEQSNGPSVSVFDPARLGQVNPVPSTLVLGYPVQQPLGGNTTAAGPVYNMSAIIRGAIFPDGTRSVLFFGRHGVGPYCYGPGTADASLAGKPSGNGVDPWCYDRADLSKGTHGYPYKYQVWAYDANDLLAVKAGKKQTYRVQPYAVWDYNLPFETDDQHVIGGVTWDPSRKLLYVSQRCADNDCSPIIHVFKLGIGSAVPDPANESAGAVNFREPGKACLSQT